MDQTPNFETFDMTEEELQQYHMLYPPTDVKLQVLHLPEELVFGADEANYHSLGHGWVFIEEGNKFHILNTVGRYLSGEKDDDHEFMPLSRTIFSIKRHDGLPLEIIAEEPTDITAMPWMTAMPYHEFEMIHWLSDDKSVYTDLDGNAVTAIRSFQLPMVAGTIPFLEKGKYGLTDCKDNVLIPCEYDHMKVFPLGTGVLTVLDNAGGLHTMQGELVLPHFYDNIFCLGDGFFAIELDGKQALYDINKRCFLSKFDYDSISEANKSSGQHLFCMQAGKDLRVMNADGAIVFQATGISLEPQPDGNWVLMVSDTNTKVLFPDFQECFQVQGVLAVHKSDEGIIYQCWDKGRGRIYNSKGELILVHRNMGEMKCVFDFIILEGPREVMLVHHGSRLVRRLHKSLLKVLGKGMYAVLERKKWTIENALTGESESNYDNLLPFKNGMCVYSSFGEWGIMDMNLRSVLPNQFKVLVWADDKTLLGGK